MKSVKHLKFTRILFLILIILLFMGFYHSHKSLPENISFAGSIHPVEHIELLTDLTYIDRHGKRHTEQTIFDAVFAIINNAKKFIVLDMFLYNDFQGKITENTRPLSSELTDALITKKNKHPDIVIVLITDPINTVYGGLQSQQLESLKKSNIHVVETKLERLRDSNPIYSAIWRVFFQVFGNTDNSEFLPNPFGQGNVSLRSYLRLLNFKANHRKLILADKDNGLIGLITSANPHDGSSAHSNIAIKFSGPAVYDLWQSEKAIINFSHANDIDIPITKPKPQISALTAQVLTESKIRDKIISAIEKTQINDEIMIATFYFSHREIINVLKKARSKGVNIRIILDPNKDAFGLEKNGIPNRQTGWELQTNDIPVKWCHTHGEQCHEKMLMVNYQKRPDQIDESILILGSANLTRRNLDDLNLETNLAIHGPSTDKVFQDTLNYFNLRWNNETNKVFTVPYNDYADHDTVKLFLYRMMETTGISTF